MKIEYVKKDLRSETLGVIERANSIISEFQADGYRMTLRQLYYQFVSKNLITNEERSYKRLASIISDGRLAGLIDWDAIEDRGRQPDVPHHYSSPAHLVETIKAAAEEFTLDRWQGQSAYVELWVEKQALASVLEPLAQRHHVTLMVNKGYSSQSAMFASAQRFREGMGTTGDRDGDVRPDEDQWFDLRSERRGVLLYLGDHDPSGEDMVRDIRDRMALFGVHELAVEKVALTTAQVRQFQPPPNPAKLTDPRADAYVREHGGSSWEVDALPPPVLNRLITAAITANIAAGPLKRVRAEEEVARKRLLKALAKVDFEGAR